MNGTIESAEELCRRAQAGDFQAAAALLDGHYQRIYAYLRRLSGSDESAADLCQQTFGRVWQSLQSFNGRSAFNTWLHRIAHNTYVDWRRRPNRHDERSDEWWETCADPAQCPFEAAADRDSAHQLYSAVEELEEDHRLAIHLHYYQGLTLEDTAATLNVATSTVKYRLRQALNKLEAALAEPRAPILRKAS